VPPPPVAGATVTSGLGDGLGDGEAGTVRVAVGVAVGVADGDAGVLAGELARAPGELARTPGEPLAVPLEGEAGVGPALRAGENEADGPAEGVDPEHAETAAEVRMVMVLQPITASLVPRPVPGPAVRTLMDPPHASRQGMAAIKVMPAGGAGMR